MMKTIVRKIGLVAHDAMKKDMIEWVLWNSERLIGHKFYCTGTIVHNKNLAGEVTGDGWDTF